MPGLHRLFRLLALTLALGLALPAPVPAQTPTPAEEAFWESIKGSNNAAEFRAYLDAFPRGAYADRARTRIRDLEGTASNVPTAPRPPDPPPYSPPGNAPGTPDYGPGPRNGSSASILTSYAMIREVQERLYGLNYAIKVMNGQLSKETRDAVKEWQQVMKRPVTGDMTEDDLETLRALPAITTWGAIAFEARGAYGAVWNRSSRQDAENDAVAECRKHTNNNAQSCTNPFTIAATQCGAMSYYSGYVGRRNNWGSFVVRRATLAEANEDAVEECRRQAKVPNACQLRASFCANGSHK